MLVKEHQRTGLVVPSSKILVACVERAEKWRSQASLAVRQKVQFDELSSLYLMGQDLQVNNNDLMTKLKNKIQHVDDWVAKVVKCVPPPPKKLSQQENVSTTFAWMRVVREVSEPSERATNDCTTFHSP